MDMVKHYTLSPGDTLTSSTSHSHSCLPSQAKSRSNSLFRLFCACILAAQHGCRNTHPARWPTSCQQIVLRFSGKSAFLFFQDDYLTSSLPTSNVVSPILGKLRTFLLFHNNLEAFKIIFFIIPSPISKFTSICKINSDFPVMLDGLS